MKKTLTRNEYLQLEGLMALYKSHDKKASELLDAMDEFLETTDKTDEKEIKAWEWATDERVKNARDLMKRLGITLKKEAK
jgi:hypothetical protein